MGAAILASDFHPIKGTASSRAHVQELLQQPSPEMLYSGRFHRTRRGKVLGEASFAIPFKLRNCANVEECVPQCLGAFSGNRLECLCALGHHCSAEVLISEPSPNCRYGPPGGPHSGPSFSCGTAEKGTGTDTLRLPLVWPPSSRSTVSAQSLHKGIAQPLPSPEASFFGFPSESPTFHRYGATNLARTPHDDVPTGSSSISSSDPATTFLFPTGLGLRPASAKPLCGQLSAFRVSPVWTTGWAPRTPRWMLWTRIPELERYGLPLEPPGPSWTPLPFSPLLSSPPSRLHAKPFPPTSDPFTPTRRLRPTLAKPTLAILI